MKEKVIYFEKECSGERKIYGRLCPDEKTEFGDYLTVVLELFRDNETGHLRFGVFQDFVEPDDVKAISEKEFLDVNKAYNLTESILTQMDRRLSAWL